MHGQLEEVSRKVEVKNTGQKVVGGKLAWRESLKEEFFLAKVLRTIPVVPCGRGMLFTQQF